MNKRSKSSESDSPTALTKKFAEAFNQEAPDIDTIVNFNTSLENFGLLYQTDSSSIDSLKLSSSGLTTPSDLTTPPEPSHVTTSNESLNDMDLNSEQFSDFEKSSDERTFSPQNNMVGLSESFGNFPSIYESAMSIESVKQSSDCWTSSNMSSMESLSSTPKNNIVDQHLSHTVSDKFPESGNSSSSVYSNSLTERKEQFGAKLSGNKSDIQRGNDGLVSTQLDSTKSLKHGMGKPGGYSSADFNESTPKTSEVLATKKSVGSKISELINKCNQFSPKLSRRRSPTPESPKPIRNRPDHVSPKWPTPNSPEESSRKRLVQESETTSSSCYIGSKNPLTDCNSNKVSLAQTATRKGETRSPFSVSAFDLNKLGSEEEKENKHLAASRQYNSDGSTSMEDLRRSNITQKQLKSLLRRRGEKREESGRRKFVTFCDEKEGNVVVACSRRWSHLLERTRTFGIFAHKHILI